MKLSLARWDYKGSSRGWWLVRELPGVALVRISGAGSDCWQVSSEPDTFEDFFHDAYDLWGHGFQFTDLTCLEECSFPTRSAALLALEAAFGDVPRPALCEVLG